MKTKEQLLKAMKAAGACWDATHYVHTRRVGSAEKIGLTCHRTQWLLWFLWGRLTPAGRELLAGRLGVQVHVDDVSGFSRPGFCYYEENVATLDRKVIDDCWRAWCRSGGKS